MKTITYYRQIVTKQLLTICFPFLICLTLPGQNTFLEKCYSKTDYKITCAASTNDGGYILTGYTGSSTSSKPDALLIKLDPKGKPVWTKVLDQPYNNYSFYISVTSDGGFIIGGAIVTGNIFSYVIKTDMEGNVEWTRKGLVSGSIKFIEQVGTGYLLAGDVSFCDEGDFFFSKLDASGDPTWSTAVGGKGGDFMKGAALSKDGGIIAVGNSYSYHDSLNPSGYDTYTVKIDADGMVEWSNAYSFGGNSSDGYSVKALDNGDYMVYMEPKFSEYQGHQGLLKLNENGNPVWAREYPGKNFGQASPITITTEGDILLPGVSTDTLGTHLMLKTDKDGNVKWQKAYTGEMGMIDYCIASIDGGLLSIIPATEKNWLNILKTDAEWDIPCITPVSYNRTSHDLTVQKIPGGIIKNPENFKTIDNAITTVLLNENMSTRSLCTGTGTTEMADATEHQRVYPNPAIDHVNIEFEISSHKTGDITLHVWDITGKKVNELNYTSSIVGNKNTFTLKTDALSNGIYYAQVQCVNENLPAGRFVVAK